MPTDLVRRGAAVLPALLLLACDSSTSPPENDGPIESARVIFANQNPLILDWSLFKVAANGTGVHEFVVPRIGAGEDLPDVIMQQPRWSPDGRRIIYRASATNTEDWYLVMVDSAGTSRRLLTAKGGFMDLAEWSPTGDRILYHYGAIPGASLGQLGQTAFVDTLGNRTDFFVEEEGVLFEGRRVYFSITTIPGAGLYDAQWDSDGAHLILVGFLDNPLSEGVTAEQVELFRVRISDGRLVARVSNNSFDEAGFVLAPDGTTVLFSRHVDEERRLLLGALPDIAAREVTAPAHDGPPRWAADSRHAVVATAVGVYLLDTAGGSAQLVAPAAGLTWPDIFCPGCLPSN